MRSLHNRLNTKSLLTEKIQNDDRDENDKVNCVNQKYLAVSYKLLNCSYLIHNLNIDFILTRLEGACLEATEVV